VMIQRNFASLRLTIAAIAISTLLAACAKTETGAPEPDTSGPQPGVLRFAEIDEPSSLNPLIASQPIVLDLSYFMYSFFFNVDDITRIARERC
jgi:hypothetical protein